MKNLKKFIKVWLMVSGRAAQTQLLTTWSGILFLIGKIIRFLLFFVFIFTVLSSAKTIAGYGQNEVLGFFLVFTLVDTIIQFVFRGIYQFRPLIVSGNFDIDLLKPLPSFFRPLFGWADILDGLTLIPFVCYFIWFMKTHFQVSADNWLLFFLFLANMLILAFAINLIIASIGILTTEIDHLTMIYRDLEAIARFPTDIYSKGIRSILTFIIPIVILITAPAKALMGLLSWQLAVASFVISGLFLLGSLTFWRFSLKRYTSASS